MRAVGGGGRFALLGTREKCKSNLKSNCSLKFSKILDLVLKIRNIYSMYIKI